VDPLNGKDTAECLNGTTPCRNLSYALLTDPRDNLTISLLSSSETHFYNESEPLRNVGHIVITGHPGEAVVQCIGNSGLAFINVTNLSISHISFNGCQADRNSTTYYKNTDDTEPEQFLVGLYFWHSRNIHLHGIQVTDSQGVGVVFFECVGENSVNSSLLAHNKWDNSTSIYKGGGGGIIVEFPYCSPGVLYGQCNITNSFNNNDSTYMFDNTTFEDNYSFLHNSSAYAFLAPGSQNHIVFGRGGGLTLYFRGRALNNSVTVSNCTFLGNKALWGGGILTEIQDTASNNTVTIRSSFFCENQVEYHKDWGTSGGAIRFGLTFYKFSTNQTNKLCVRSCHFFKNKAYTGGGLSLILTHNGGASGKESEMYIGSCVWKENVARLGAAIDITRWGTVFQGNVPTILEDNTFEDNSVSYSNDPTLILGSGTVYIDTVSVYMFGNNHFHNNHGTALVVRSAAVTFNVSKYASVGDEFTTTFLNNTGRSGGAIALYGDAWITVSDNCQLVFEENQASFRGGAIYAEAIGNRNLISTRRCFIQYSNVTSTLTPEFYKNISFNFTNNKAAYGCSIYATSLVPCVWGTAAGSGDYTPEELKKVFNGILFHYERTDNHSCYEVASAPSNAAFNKGNNLETHYVYSGADFYLPFSVTDDYSHVLEGQSFYVTSSNHGKVNVSSEFAISSTNYVKIRGCPRSSSTLSFVSEQDPLLSVEVRVNISECPPGFTKDGSKCICRCLNEHPIERCQASIMTAFMHLEYWYGCSPGTPHNTSLASYQGPYVYAACSLGFCNHNVFSRTLPLLNSTDNTTTCDSLNRHICNYTGQNRMGVMCWQCTEEHGLSLTSWDYDCVLCPDTPPAKVGAFFILIAAEIIPLLLYVLFFVIFDFNILSGPLYSFVFICQVKYTILPQHSVLDDNRYSVLMDIDRFLSGIFNLRFFGLFATPHSCISKDLTVLNLLLIRYAIVSIPFIFFALFLVVVRLYQRGLCCRPLHYLLARVFRCITKIRAGGSPNSTIIQGLCSFFVLAYSDLIRISAQILTPAYMYYANSQSLHSARVQVQGNLPVVNVHYLPYALVAITVLIICVALPCFLLLTRPLVPRLISFLKLERKRPFRWIVSFYGSNRLKPFFDCFQGCFRPNMEIFAGLFLFYRVAFYIPLMTPKDPNHLLLANLIIIFTIFCLHSIFQPYRKEKKYVNKIDSVMFLLIGLLETLIYFNYVAHGFDSKAGDSRGSSWFQLVVQFMPYVVILGVLVWHVYSSERVKHLGRKLRRALRINARPSEQPLEDSFEGSYGTFDRRSESLYSSQ
jgi:predicted outer membrane repeat protein